MILPSSATSQWARARGSGAGPRTTAPVGAYWDPWHGHMNLLLAADHGTTHPKCVQTVEREVIELLQDRKRDIETDCSDCHLPAFKPYDSSVLSSLTIRYLKRKNHIC